MADAAVLSRPLPSQIPRKFPTNHRPVFAYNYSSKLSLNNPSFLFFTRKNTHKITFRLNQCVSSLSQTTLKEIEIETKENVDAESVDEDELVEVGQIANVHGIRGEVRVMPNTDFPELRFLKPGIRWLKYGSINNMKIEKFTLVKGREHAGRNQWLLKFKEIDTVEKAKDFIGASILVKIDDRPTLAADEFYSADLVGMRVFLKDTSELVGTVFSVYNTGAHDLLRVKLSKNRINDSNGSADELDSDDKSAPLIWIPFVEPIVPVVDLQMRHLLITPPEGLLELNLSQKGPSNKDTREKEFKERKKTGLKLSAIKRKLNSIGQEHVLRGLSTGEDSQKQVLLDQIFSFDYKLFSHALEDSLKAYDRYDLSRYIDTSITKKWWLSSKTFKGKSETANKEVSSKGALQLERKGLELIAEGQLAVLLFMDAKYLMDESHETKDSEHVDNKKTLDWQTSLKSCSDQLLSVQNLISSDDASRVVSIPLIIHVTEEMQSDVESYFKENDYNGLQEEQVWFMTQEYLPCISKSSQNSKEKILMGSQWEISRAPVGSGSIPFSLSNQNMIERLKAMGINYLQICSLNCSTRIADPSFIAFVNKKAAEVGVKLVTGRVHGISEETSSGYKDAFPYALYLKEKESPMELGEVKENNRQNTLLVHRDDNGSACFDMIFTLQYAWRLTKKLYKTEYLKEPLHVSDNTETSNSQNAYQLQSSIYSLLKFSPSDRIALLLYR